MKILNYYTALNITLVIMLGLLFFVAAPHGYERWVEMQLARAGQ